MTLFKENKILAIILAVAVLASCIVIGQRMSVESNNKTVDVILDYEEMELMADQSDKDLSWWLSEFAQMGITKVGLYEETLDSLTKSDKPVKAELVSDLRKDTYWMNQAPQEVLDMIGGNVRDNFDVMVIAGSKQMFDFVKRAFEERYDPNRMNYVETEDGGYILIDGSVADSLYDETEKLFMTEGTGFREIDKMSSSLIMYLNIGLLPEKVDLIKAAGCTVEPRTVGYAGWNDKRFIDDVTAQYRSMDVVPDYWIMGSKQVPGFDEGTEALNKYLKDENVTIGIVENTTQRENISPEGMEQVIENSDYNVVRVFSVWPYIQNRYQYYGYDSYQEIENSLFRAVVERNIKIIYYKPMKEKKDDYTYITDIQEYKDSFANFEERLAEHGISLGKASVSEPYKVPLLLKLLVAIGAGCAALFCLKAFLPINRKWMWILFGLGCVGVAGAFFIAPNLSTIITSFAASVMLPCLSVIWMIYEASKERARLGSEAGVFKIIGKGIIILIAGILISLAGAVMTAAPISSINFMLELDIFRGVKISQLLPLAFFALLFFIFAMRLWGTKTKETLEVQDIKWFMNYDIKVWMVLIGLIMALAGYVYLARTGHETGIEASSAELLARNYLEEVLYARPRTKEFLIAFPAVMLFVYSMVRELKIFAFIFGAAGVIGFTSVVNTFMHIRTPLELGFARTGYSVLFGIVLGIVYVIVFEGLYRLIRKRRSLGDAAS